MPTIYDNIEIQLSDALKENLTDADRADFCIGYFNLRGWGQLSSLVDKLHGVDDPELPDCRILLGMYGENRNAIRELYGQDNPNRIDQQHAVALKKELARRLKEQLTVGVPTNRDERDLRKLAKQLKKGMVRVKLFTRTSLHAKLYLIYDEGQKVAKKVGFLGSSNLTFSGLNSQGELNIDVVEQDAAGKLSKWFHNRWKDRFSIDITEELIEILEESWAGERLISPYHIYLKMAYHLSRDARAGVQEFELKDPVNKKLLPFQRQAVFHAAKHIQKRNGVMIGDVVGLGKTYTACALAHIFEEEFFYRTLIICPANLDRMWKDYRQKFNLRADILKISMVQNKLRDLKRYQLVIIDESHNLRNPEGKRYSIIKDYIAENDSNVILLTATPYNKTLLDLSSQLALFVKEGTDLGIAPEQYLNSIGGEDEFIASHQTHSRSLKAFEKSPFIEDWQELMRHYLVRRTRTFIKENYAKQDNGRYYLEFEDGDRSYFPERIARKFEYKFSPDDPDDQYGQLYSDKVVNLINGLQLPRYGLALELKNNLDDKLENGEDRIVENLSRAGKRLMGFCRTNLFKRLESSGHAFLLSVARHAYRNYIFLAAIEAGEPLPIGSQESGLIDEFLGDTDLEDGDLDIQMITEEENFLAQAKKTYNLLSVKYRHQYDWIRSELFQDSLKEKLQQDCDSLLKILEIGKIWTAENDRQLNAVFDFCTTECPDDKILVFTQYSDTAYYLYENLKDMGLSKVDCVTGDSDDPTKLAYKFSPNSNEKEIAQEDQIRVLISTDVLSEGQNLQDCHIIINYDLPWALIRLIQRAGRIDRIGQEAEQIYCYSILPEDGLNDIIRLRGRLENRIQQNAEVVGSDETFFEGDPVIIRDIYNENSSILEEEEDEEVDLASYAYEIWNRAIERDPGLEKTVRNLPDVVYSTKENPSKTTDENGVLIYAKTVQDNDVLTWINQNNEIVTHSQYKIMKAAECAPEEEPLQPQTNHHALVKEGIEHINEQSKKTGGQLGGKRSIRYRTFHTLDRYIENVEGTIFQRNELREAADQIYKYPLKEFAKSRLQNLLKSSARDEEFADLVLSLHENKELCLVDEQVAEHDGTPKIICSLGLKN